MDDYETSEPIKMKTSYVDIRLPTLCQILVSTFSDCEPWSKK
jgi:hypothetical protein